MTTTYPLLFRFSNLLVNGRGFAAGILAEGRMLAEQEDDGSWCINGVTPAGLAEGGQQLHEALERFRETFHEILFDIAADTGTFEEFEERAQAFFAEPPDSDLDRWVEAVESIRTGAVAPPAGISRGDAGRPCSITVIRLDAANGDYFSPSANSTDAFFVPDEERPAA